MLLGALERLAPLVKALEDENRVPAVAVADPDGFDRIGEAGFGGAPVDAARRDHARGLRAGRAQQLRLQDVAHRLRRVARGPDVDRRLEATPGHQAG